MKDLKDILYETGEAWREEHKTVKIITAGPRAGETEVKIPVPSLNDTSKVLIEFCQFILIGRSNKTDKSPLYLYNYDTGLYSESDDLFGLVCRWFDKRIHPNAWDSIKKIIRLSTKLKEPFDNPTLVPVNNGIVNLETKELLPFSPKYAITSKIATSYNQNANKPTFKGNFDFDEWLSEIACHDEEVVTLLWQIMNEAINPNYTRGKMAILVGDGLNGKGTFQKLLINLIGKGNVATLKPDQFGERFKLSTLIGKVCNIGDDISSKYLDSVSDLMSVVTGEAITVEEKHQPSYEVELKLFCMFSGNDLPNARNKSFGWYRRLCIVPFNADFKGTKERPEIKNVYFKDRNLLEWLLYQIINMESFKDFIEPEVVKKELQKYQKHNDYTLAWATDVYIPSGWHELPKVPLFLAKDQLETYLKDSGITNYNLYGFGNKLINHLKNETSQDYVIRVGRLSSDEVSYFKDSAYSSEKLKKSGSLIIKE